MSEKWTPGPWEYEPHGQSIWQTAGKYDGCMISDIMGWGYLRSTAATVEDATAIQNANGYLIAAAPEMYEALQSIVNDLPSSRDWLDPVIERIAMAALKKARGES